MAYYTLGLLAFSTLTITDTADHAPVFHALIAVPFGWLPFAVLVLRELDESFTNVYSTAVSVQNLRPLADRRVLAVVVGTIATIGALALNISDYQNFLYLIGSVFVPMFAVFAVDYFLLGGRARWNTDETAPTRWLMLVPVGARLRRLPADQSGQRVVVGRSLGVTSNRGCTSPRRPG